DVTQINVEAKQGQMNMQEEVFRAMANEQISVDFINISPNNVVYTVKDQLAEKAEKILLDKGYNPVLERNCAKVSDVGAGIPGVASKIVSALSEQGIRILQSADSYTTIWVLIKKDDLEKAVNALHDAFQLEDVEKDAFSIDEHSSFKTT